MIIGYDRRPNATMDQKIQSLIESIQLALNEIVTELDYTNKKIEQLEQRIKALE